MKPRFWIDGERLQKGEVGLSQEESHHLVKVLRLRAGSEVDLFNGRGGLAHATVVTPSAKTSLLLIHSVTQVENPSQLTVCFSLPKPTAHDFIIRRCTELGILGFQPLITAYSLRRAKADSARCGKMIREVCKQCHELWIPQYHAPAELASWLSSRSTKRRLVFCYEKEGGKSPHIHSEEGVDIVLGPEGGFSESEAELLTKAGALLLGLGKNRLRAETAALVATALVKKQLGE